MHLKLRPSLNETLKCITDGHEIFERDYGTGLPVKAGREGGVEVLHH